MYLLIECKVDASGASMARAWRELGANNFTRELTSPLMLQWVSNKKAWW